MVTFLFKKKFSAIPNNRKIILQQIFEALAKKKITLTNVSLSELKLILDEAISNALEHGCSWNNNLCILIEISQEEKNLFISITDEGPGFDYTKFLKKNKDKPAVTKRRGRGICIIQYFITPNWKNNGKTIILPFDIE